MSQIAFIKIQQGQEEFRIFALLAVVGLFVLSAILLLSSWKGNKKDRQNLPAFCLGLLPWPFALANFRWLTISKKINVSFGGLFCGCTKWQMGWPVSRWGKEDLAGSFPPAAGRKIKSKKKLRSKGIYSTQALYLFFFWSNATWMLSSFCSAFLWQPPLPGWHPAWPRSSVRFALRAGSHVGGLSLGLGRLKSGPVFYDCSVLPDGFQAKPSLFFKKPQEHDPMLGVCISVELCVKKLDL